MKMQEFVAQNLTEMLKPYVGCILQFGIWPMFYFNLTHVPHFGDPMENCCRFDMVDFSLFSSTKYFLNRCASKPETSLHSFMYFVLIYWCK